MTPWAMKPRTGAKGGMKLGVSVCGMPSSGNRLVATLLAHHGATTSVRHWGNIVSDLDGWHAKGFEVCAVWPVRDLWANRAGCEAHRHTKKHASHEAAMAVHYERTAAALARLQVPIRFVSYSTLVSDPESTGRELVEWCGLEWRGWHEPVHDGDAKYGNARPTQESPA